MVTPTTHKQNINVNDLVTNAVVLYPTRAQVTRDLSNIEIQPGFNEIEIYGITPSADEHSIKFDGPGTSFIIDMTVGLVPNKDSFQDTYPDEDEEDDVESANEADEECPAIVEIVDRKLKSLKLKSEEAGERRGSAQNRLNTLDEFSRSLATRDTATTESIVQTLSMYKAERAKAYADYKDANLALDDIQEELTQSEKEREKIMKGLNAHKRKAEKKRTEDEANNQRQKEQRSREKHCARAELRKFWPRMVYKVTLHLEASIETPGISRRSSMSSVTMANKDYLTGQEDDSQTCSRTLSLTMTYVTSRASWTPRYDISFSTVNKSGTITYRAEFMNQTSETWSDSSISLSTSQASFHGLDDEVPWMKSWRVGLEKGNQGTALYSIQESFGKSSNVFGNKARSELPSSSLFGVPPSSLFHNLGANAARVPDENFFGEPQPNRAHLGQQYQRHIGPPPTVTQLGSTGGGFGSMQVRSAGLLVSEPAAQANTAASGTSLFGAVSQMQATPRGTGLFGSQPATQANAPPPPPSSSLFGGMRSSQPAPGGNPSFGAQVATQQMNAFANLGSSRAVSRDHEMRTIDNIHTERDNAQQTNDGEDTTWEDEGLTTTYDVPSKRTLEPSSLARRHKIATLRFSNLELNSITVPKLRAAAFLRACFKNPSSSLTLPKGTAGLTLDGTFLGTTTLPRVSPGESITMPLGVDPAVHVGYAKPTVKYSSSGVFNKESSQTFSRSITLTNTKPTAVELLVLDQVPVSEEEKLKVDTLSPVGLVKQGSCVVAGVYAKEKEKDKIGRGLKWGSAKATLKKDGEVAWQVRLEPGGAGRLVLEYETRCPGTEAVVSK